MDSCCLPLLSFASLVPLCAQKNSCEKLECKADKIETETLCETKGLLPKKTNMEDEEEHTNQDEPSAALFCPVYKELNKICKMVPTNTGLGGISGHFTQGSFLKLFKAMDRKLKYLGLAWEDQVFLDVGFGDGYPLFCASQLCLSYGIDIDLIMVRLFRKSTSVRVHTKFKPQVALANIEDWKEIPSNVTVLYSFNAAFPKETNNHFLKLVLKAENLKCIVLAKRKSNDLVYKEEIVCTMSGSNERHTMIVI